LTHTSQQAIKQRPANNKQEDIVYNKHRFELTTIYVKYLTS